MTDQLLRQLGEAVALARAAVDVADRRAALLRQLPELAEGQADAMRALDARAAVVAFELDKIAQRWGLTRHVVSTH